MSVDDLDQTPTAVLLQRTVALARSEPVVQSDEYWAHIRALHFRGNRDVFEEAVGLCANPDPISRAVGADILAQLGVRKGASIQQTQRYLNVTDEEMRRGLEVSWKNEGRPLHLASGS